MLMMGWGLWMVAEVQARPPVAAEMHDRYALLTEARNFTVAGDLEQARAAGQQLAAIEPPSRVPKAWEPWLARLDAHAASLGEAPDLLQAALQIGQAAATCGGCHHAHRGGPSLEHGASIPHQTWDEGMNMPLHQWSVNWMWLGLIGHDDEAWRRGAEALDSQPLAPKFEGAPPPGSRPQLEQLVYVLAERALTGDPAARGTVMGQLLATCAECHRQGDGAVPTPPTPESSD